MLSLCNLEINNNRKTLDIIVNYETIKITDIFYI